MPSASPSSNYPNFFGGASLRGWKKVLEAVHTTAVSYTHLDVYKRQHAHFFMWSFLIQEDSGIVFPKMICNHRPELFSYHYTKIGRAQV